MRLRSAEKTLEAVRSRLRLWGLDDDQITELERSASPTEAITIRAPLGGVVVRKDAVEGRYVELGSPLYTIADLSQVWVALAAYESDLVWLRRGQNVTFTAPAQPGSEFTGEILFIDPVLDDRTRTVEVRMAAANPHGILKPGMLVRAQAEVTLDATGAPVPPEIHGSSETARGIDPPLVVPASAPLWTGARSVVYVRLPGRSEPTFSGREVILGPRAGHYYLVVSGLVEGEQVVTNGNFKIDSALQIQARPSMMNPADGSTPPGHHRPADDLAVTTGHRLDAATRADASRLEAPACFIDGLGEILTAYLALHLALAGDDDAAARVAADQVTGAVAGVSCAESHLSAASGETWREIYANLERAAAQIKTADGIGPRRLAFQPLSDNLWTALTRFGYAATDTVRRFHCPMALAGAGADWIQLDVTTANPYYGASMLRCGWQTEVIAAPDTAVTPRLDHGQSRDEDHDHGRAAEQG
jgi:Cu(I)/Ag(I) efflux system membrane fusion protein